MDRQESNLHIRHTIATEICTPFRFGLPPTLALPLSYYPPSIFRLQGLCRSGCFTTLLITQPLIVFAVSLTGFFNHIYHIMFQSVICTKLKQKSGITAAPHYASANRRICFIISSFSSLKSESIAIEDNIS